MQFSMENGRVTCVEVGKNLLPEYVAMNLSLLNVRPLKKILKYICKANDRRKIVLPRWLTFSLPTLVGDICPNPGFDKHFIDVGLTQSVFVYSLHSRYVNENCNPI